MNQKSKTKLIFLLFLASLIVFKPSVALAAIETPTSYEIKISAAIGEPKLTLFGYGPAKSTVKLSGRGVSDQTKADQTGYFIFKNVFFPKPLPSLEDPNKFVYPEICLFAVDEVKRTTHPTCIPPLPSGNLRYEIGPVLLSPTITIDKGAFQKGEQIRASGKTTPNTSVNIYLAREKSPKGSFVNIVKTTYAYYLPTYQTTSDSSGNFEFNLPSDSAAKWRVFAAADIRGAKSPKSNTLVFSVHSVLFSILELFKLILKYIKAYLFIVFVVLEIFIFAYLLFVWKHRPKTAKITHKKAPTEYLEIQKRYLEYLRSKGLLKLKKK